MFRCVFFLLLICLLSACVEEYGKSIEEDMDLVQSFNYNTVSEIQINILLEDNAGEAFKGVKVSLWSVESDKKGVELFKGFTDSNGELQSAINLPTRLSEVMVVTNYIGIPNDIKVPILAGNINFNYEEGVLRSQVVEEQVSTNEIMNTKSTTNNLTFNYMSAYDSQGVPDTLEAVRDVISATLLEYINASLPENQPVPQYHPTFLANGKKTTLDVEETADVWVTFVHEGAGFRNAIGFYTYNTLTPPQSIDDISVINVVFPNLSYAWGGGGLFSGDKVYIGQYDAGTSIGMVLMADGWDGTNSEDYYHIVFADKKLNPESEDDLKQHNVLLWDAENELFLIGFEDIRRDHLPIPTDNDFNDAILFVTSNPVDAISTENVNPIDRPGTLDTDGDGINDILDEYPDDPDRAYNSFYPSSITYGTFAFEDNWPDYGDYDFNDLVVDYQFKHVQNSNNLIVDMEPTFKIRAIGAMFRNGFGFSTNLLPTDVSSATGALLNEGYVTNNANGTESGQTNAVFVVLENVFDLFNTYGYVNTEEGEIYHTPQDITMSITFTSPKSYADIGTAPYNPFLIVAKDREREIHLPGYQPTDLANAALFGSLDDNTNVGTGVYYKSKTSLPWAIHLPETFAYPREHMDIRQGHLKFTDWATSSGASFADWYRSENGYRSNSYLYNAN